MKEIVFLLEEPSAKSMLQSLLPRLLEPEISYRLIPFEGKQDLEKQIVRRIRGYQNTQARFIVLRDQDSHPDCCKLKERLVELCRSSGKGEQCLVRIACTELETFYLADLQAVELALGVKGLTRQQSSKKFRSPDRLGSPSRELKIITNNVYEKVAGSRSIGQYLNLENDRSPSFRNLIDAVRRQQDALFLQVV